MRKWTSRSAFCRAGSTACPRRQRRSQFACSARADRLAEAIDNVARIAPGLQRIRVHGDYQLDQVLVAGGQFVIIDFEGEPLRLLADRRAKFLALKDVAGMARSYSYAAYAALFDVASADEELAGRLDPIARWWQGEATTAFVRAYRETVDGAAFVPPDRTVFDTLLSAFLVEKATYELRYEIEPPAALAADPAEGDGGPSGWLEP